MTAAIFTIDVNVNIGGPAINSLLAALASNLANSAAILKGLQMVTDAVQTLQTQVTALTAEVKVANDNADALEKAVNDSTTTIAGLNQQIADLVANSGMSAEDKAAISAITDQVAQATQDLTDTVARDPVPAAPAAPATPAAPAAP